MRSSMHKLGAFAVVLVLLAPSYGCSVIEKLRGDKEEEAKKDDDSKEDESKEDEATDKSAEDALAALAALEDGGVDVDDQDPKALEKVTRPAGKTATNADPETDIPFDGAEASKAHKEIDGTNYKQAFVDVQSKYGR